MKGCLAPFFKKKPTGVSPKQGMPQNSGTNQKKGGSGTQNMQERLLKTCHLSQEFVFNAEGNSHQSKNQISALTHVGKKITTEKIESRKLVIAAARYLKLLLFRDRCNAVKNVQQLSLGESVEVYNLTLDRENVYYANGILVQNCADAAVMALHVARVRHGLSSNEKAAVVLRHTKNPDFSLDFLTKKPSQSSFPENRLITFGGGWAKQI